MKKYLKAILLLSGIIGNTYGSNQITLDENSADSFEKQMQTARSALSTAQPNLVRTLGLTPDKYDQRSPTNAPSPLLAEVVDRIEELRYHTSKYSQRIKSLDLFVDLSNIFDPETANQLKSYNTSIENLNRAKNGWNYLSSMIPALKANKVSAAEKIAIEKILLMRFTDITNTTFGRDYARTQKSLLKEAQQNCLGTVTGITYKNYEGSKQAVVMTPHPLDLTRPKPIVPKGPIVMNGLSWEDIVAEVERTFAHTTASAQRSEK